MAIFQQLSKEEIRENFTHYGMMYSIVPVYLKDPTGIYGPIVQVRNWIPDWFLDVADAIFFASAKIGELINPDFEPLFWYVVTGEIER